MVTVVSAGILESTIQASDADRRTLLWLNSVPGLTAHDWAASGEMIDAGAPTYVDHRVPPPHRELSGIMGFEASSTYDWFDNVHAWPTVADLGLVLGPVEVTVELYNAWRRIPQSFNSTDLAAVGAGVSLTGLPTLSHVYPPLDGSGDEIKIVVTLDGDPVVDADIDLSWTDGETPVRLILQRIIPWATLKLGVIRPEDEYGETLSSLTDVIEKSDGLEQRLSLRKNPRRGFQHTYKIDEGVKRAELDLLLAATQHSLFGVPVWQDETRTTAASSIGDTTLSVQSTAFMDYRVGGSVAVLIEGGVYDVRGISVVGATSLTLTAPLENDFPVGSPVVPMLAATLPPTVAGSRFNIGLTTIDVEFDVAENDAELADASAFPAYNSRPILSDYNFMGSKINESLSKRMVVVDSVVGKRFQTSSMKKSRMITAKRFVTKTQQTGWEVRQLLHSLRGRFASWYLPTFRNDFEVTQDELSASSALNIVDSGYRDYAFANGSKTVIRITMNDGTVYTKTVIAVTALLANETTLTLSTTWGATLVKNDIARAEFVNLVRFDDDTIRFSFRKGSRTMVVDAPVREVLQ